MNEVAGAEIKNCLFSNRFVGKMGKKEQGARSLNLSESALELV
jgi:hypothetical protein